MKILLANQKGGCGKSTIAINIASVLDDVLIIDADRQKSLANSLFKKKFNIITGVNDLRKVVAKQTNKNIVIDTQGRDCIELRSALLCVDVVIVPFVPSNFDLSTLTTINDIINQAKKGNFNLQSYALINYASSHYRINDVTEAKKCIKKYSDLKVLKSYLCTRNCYRDMGAFGKTIFELNNHTAIDEFKKVLKELKINE